MKTLAHEIIGWLCEIIAFFAIIAVTFVPFFIAMRHYNLFTMPGWYYVGLDIGIAFLGSVIVTGDWPCLIFDWIMKDCDEKEEP